MVALSPDLTRPGLRPVPWGLTAGLVLLVIGASMLSLTSGAAGLGEGGPFSGLFGEGEGRGEREGG